MQEIKSTCCYCGVGCGIIIETEDDKVINVKGDPTHPANFGRLCTKGSTLHLTTDHDTRALYPEMRKTRDESLQRQSWATTLDFVAEKFSAIIKAHGPDSVAFYISGQLLTEDYYAFNKLAKGLIGTNNVDTNSRLCMSSAVSGYKSSLGADAPPSCYEDIDFAQCILIAGSNTAYAHPIVYRRIEDARKKNPDLKIIVVDPRKTLTARESDLHLAILPGTDVALFHGMLHVLLWEGYCNMDYIANHTEGFAELKASLREYTPSAVARICGIKAEEIEQAAKWFGASGASLSLYCQGLNQSAHGTDKNTALINLHLATAQIGKPGAGPFSLTGQPNAMGGREVGGMANLLSAHRDLKNPEQRAEVAKLWGIAAVPEKPGKTAIPLFQALRKGEIKAVWIACTNPAQSMPHQSLVREALQKAELVVLQEAYRHTDTSLYADVILPAAAWPEKEGTVTNSERCITHVNAATKPPGQARPDWEIVVDFAHRLGKGWTQAPAKNLFPYTKVEQIFNEHRESTRGRDLDITGLSYALLDQSPQQWPLPSDARSGKRRLYEDGVFATPSGRAQFVNCVYHPTAEQIDARYPLHFNTGRLRDQWHGMTRTGTVARLFNHVAEPLLAMHKDDMDRRGLIEGDIAKVTGARGEILVRIELSEQMRPGQVFMPMHWGGQFMNNAGSNALTSEAIDPISNQPELKHAKVQVEKIDLPWQLVGMRRQFAENPDVERGPSMPALMQSLQPFLTQFDYATLNLYGRESPVLVLQASNESPPSPQLLNALDALLGLTDTATTMTFDDKKRGISKRVRLAQDQVLAVRLSGETKARDWLKELLASGASAAAVRPWMLAPVLMPPVGAPQRGVIICNCLDISLNEIQDELNKGSDLSRLQAELKCGTVCGSCVPELKRLCALALE